MQQNEKKIKHGKETVTRWYPICEWEGLIMNILEPKFCRDFESCRNVWLSYLLLCLFFILCFYSKDARNVAENKIKESG